MSFFFFKQKTAYEMRISDWSSDVCSSDLQISSAKISTYGEQVVDVFYLKDIFGMKVEHERKLKQIQERLSQALDDPTSRAAPKKPPRRPKRRTPKAKTKKKGAQASAEAAESKRQIGRAHV